MTRIWNKFHNTTIRVRASEEEVDRLLFGANEWDLTDTEKAKVRRWHNALCGVKDCKCFSLTEIVVDDID